jgi:hypothetical protein
VVETHHAVAYGLLAVAAATVTWGALAYVRGGGAGGVLSHLLALSQTIIIAQVALGLLLLSDGKRAPDELHYLYGTLALLASLSPWLYAPPVPARRLAWFVGATLFATALSVRAYTTAS